MAEKLGDSGSLGRDDTTLDSTRIPKYYDLVSKGDCTYYLLKDEFRSKNYPLTILVNQPAYAHKDPNSYLAPLR